MNKTAGKSKMSNWFSPAWRHSKTISEAAGTKPRKLVFRPFDPDLAFLQFLNASQLVAISQNGSNVQDRRKNGQ